MDDDLVCKFVVKDGENFGESIDIHGDNIIVKVGSEFLAVSIKKIEKVESDKIYISDFDMKEAENLGKKWIDEKSKPVSFEELKIFGFEERKESGAEAEVEDKSK
ncbi:MAG TPA: hypothetical protein EYP30_08420 [Archaeoglobaceae archaeon]|nr:hypothetical protein [Archaeoglobaceae archaeon]